MNNPPEDYEQRGAWFDSLTPDERLVLQVPVGWLWTFFMVGFTKRMLLVEKLEPAEKLLVLEKLNGLTEGQGGYFTREKLAIIEPMADAEYAIWREARSLDPPGDKMRNASFRLLTSPRVAWLFVLLNPSYLAAMKLPDGRGQHYEGESRGALPAAQTQISSAPC